MKIVLPVDAVEDFVNACLALDVRLVTHGSTFTGISNNNYIVMPCSPERIEQVLNRLDGYNHITVICAKIEKD